MGRVLGLGEEGSKKKKIRKSEGEKQERGKRSADYTDFRRLKSMRNSMMGGWMMTKIQEFRN